MWDGAVLLYRPTLPAMHRAWLAATALVALACAAAYAWEWRQNWHDSGGRLPGGGSLVGLACGILAGVICLFEAALVLRKTSWLRTRRTVLGIPLGSARFWMAAHIWLGLLAVPLVLLHSGFRFGGPLSSLLAWTFIIVIASGVLGLVLQNVLPRLLTEVVPDETIYSQIDEVGRQLAQEALRLARLYGGEQGNEPLEESAEEPAELIAARAVQRQVAGAPRRVGTMRELARQPAADLPADADSPELRAAVLDEVVPFLRTGRDPADRLTGRQRSEWFFDDLRRRVGQDAAPAVARIETLCQRRRQFNLQARIHFWLHTWLSIHLPLSVALIWLLAAHVVGALVYS